MRLLRLGPRGAERPHVLVSKHTAVDVGDLVADFDPEFFASGALTSLPDLVRDHAGRARPIDGRRVGAPVAKPGKIVCIGLNYRDHARETGVELPAEPIVFLKAPNTLIGPYDDVIVPRGSLKTDWEIELGVVIGARVRYAESVDEAASAIAGFMICNDVSEREYQLERGGQWDKGKSCESFNPAGPWLVTTDEVGMAAALRMVLDVNEVRRQDSSTAEMHTPVPELIRYVSQFMVLDPGDILNTGTPAGVALARPETPYLRPGDRMRLKIDGLGEQRLRVVAAG